MQRFPSKKLTGSKAMVNVAIYSMQLATRDNSKASNGCPHQALSILAKLDSPQSK